MGVPNELVGMDLHVHAFSDHLEGFFVLVPLLLGVEHWHADCMLVVTLLLSLTLVRLGYPAGRFHCFVALLHELLCFYSFCSLSLFPAPLIVVERYFSC